MEFLRIWVTLYIVHTIQHKTDILVCLSKFRKYILVALNLSEIRKQITHKCIFIIKHTSEIPIVGTHFQDI